MNLRFQTCEALIGQPLVVLLRDALASTDLVNQRGGQHRPIDPALRDLANNVGRVLVVALVLPAKQPVEGVVVVRVEAALPRRARLAQQLGDQFLQRVRRAVVLVARRLVDQRDLAGGGQRAHDLHAIGHDALAGLVQRAVDGRADHRRRDVGNDPGREELRLLT